jgi:phosphoribosylanthranilate isomerase
MPTRVRVKICGITSLRDAELAVAAGADALGFMCYARSPRWIQPEAAREIVRALPPFVSAVGVFVDAEEALVRRVVTLCGLDAVQFHGDETPEYCARFGTLRVFKAFRVRDAQSLQRLTDYPTNAWLLDAFVPEQPGGTGRTFNWDLALQAKRLGRPIILAGGLTPENVADAVRRVQPYAVDVSSGVESAPGRKDPAKMQAFVQAVAMAGG